MNLLEKLRQSRIGLITGVLLNLALGVILLFLFSKRLDFASYDLAHRFSTTGEAPTNVVIVYMDDASADELGQDMTKPWDRALHAQLVKNLHADGARAVVFDIVFAGEGTPESNEAFARALKDFGKGILGAEMVLNTFSGLTNIVAPIEQFSTNAVTGLVTLAVEENNAVREHWHYFPDIPTLSWAAAEVSGVTPRFNKNKKYWLRYYGPPGTLPSVSYYRAIIENGLPKGFFSGKTVFVGAKPTTGFAGTGKDEFKTPYTLWTRSYAPGVEVHATSYLNLVRDEWIRRVTPASHLAIAILLSIIAGGALTLCVPWLSAVLAMLVIAALYFSANIAWHNNIWFNWMVLGLQVAGGLFWAIIYNSLNWYVQRRMMLETLSVHLSPARARAVMKQPDLLKPGAEMHEISILFSDIANFSSISEKLAPNELAFQLNQYFEGSISSIHEADGTIVKLIGDAIFAIWNAPNAQKDHQILACRAALNLREQLQLFSKTNPELTKYITRVGLHTGVASVGNFGSKTRFDYTAMGDSVNLASRLEGLNKFLGTDILISDDLFRGLNGQFLTRSVGKFRFKGFDRAIEVHELISPTNGAIPKWVEEFKSAVPLYQEAKFDAAESRFRSVLNTKPDDGPSKFYLEQISYARSSQNFTGIIELKEK